MMIIIGMILGWLKEFTFLGLALIETFVLWLAFNWLAPNLIDYGVTLPFVKVAFWHLYLGIVILHSLGTIIGRFIKALIPTLVKINTNQEQNT